MSSKTVLIVEDEPVLAATLRDACASEGHIVEIATDGEAGLKVALEKNPQIILLDIKMPKMDGLTMLQNLVAQQKDPKSKVYMFTNSADTEKIEESMAHGAAGYFIKAQTQLADITAKLKE